MTDRLHLVSSRCVSDPESYFLLTFCWFFFVLKVSDWQNKLWCLNSPPAAAPPSLCSILPVSAFLSENEAVIWAQHGAVIMICTTETQRWTQQEAERRRRRWKWVSGWRRSRSTSKTGLHVLLASSSDCKWCNTSSIWDEELLYLSHFMSLSRREGEMGRNQQNLCHVLTTGWSWKRFCCSKRTIFIIWFPGSRTSVLIRSKAAGWLYSPTCFPEKNPVRSADTWR